jgi:tetratricopeptide (TPR) repeat protein
MRRALALSLLVMVALAGNVFGSEAARLSGKIFDSQTKQPIPDAMVKIEAVEGKNYTANQKAKKDGSYALMVMTGTIKYRFTFEAPGYAPYSEVMKLKIGEANLKDVVLTKADVAAAQQTATIPASQIKVDPAVAAFNDGAALANEGKSAEALAKFEEAVAAKPDMAAAWSAIARVTPRLKNYKRAIEAANKMLEIDPDDSAMYSILYDAYTATGEKAKAAEAKAKMPADANSLYNDAAKAINAGKDADAEKLLQQALSVDDNFAAAHYELGMVYVRSQKNADAKKHLTRYIELEPTGKDASTAKEMLKYVQ